MKKFERIKTHFNGATSQSWHFDFNLNSQSPSQRRGRVVLQAEDVRDLYEPVLRNIFDLILSQITAANEKCGRHVIKVSVSFILALWGTYETNIIIFYRKLSWLADSAPHPICRKA